MRPGLALVLLLLSSLALPSAQPSHTDEGSWNNAEKDRRRLLFDPYTTFDSSGRARPFCPNGDALRYQEVPPDPKGKEGENATAIGVLVQSAADGSETWFYLQSDPVRRADGTPILYPTGTGDCETIDRAGVRYWNASATAPSLQPGDRFRFAVWFHSAGRTQGCPPVLPVGGSLTSRSGPAYTLGLESPGLGLSVPSDSSPRDVDSRTNPRNIVDILRFGAASDPDGWWRVPARPTGAPEWVGGILTADYVCPALPPDQDVVQKRQLHHLRLKVGDGSPPDPQPPSEVRDPTGWRPTLQEVSLRWHYPGYDGGTDLEGYRVYRSSGSSWTLLSETTARSFTDPAAPPGGITYAIVPYGPGGEGPPGFVEIPALGEPVDVSAGRDVHAGGLCAGPIAYIVCAGGVAVSAFGDAKGSVLAASLHGDAEGIRMGPMVGGEGLVAASGTNRARGTVAVSGTGEADACRGAAPCRSGQGGGFLALSGTGLARSPFMAVSGGDAEASTAVAQRNARGNHAVTVLGDAEGRWEDCSGTACTWYDGEGYSLAGDSRGITAVSGTGDASTTCDSSGCRAVSLTGRTSGEGTRLSGCETAEAVGRSEACLDPV